MRRRSLARDLLGTLLVFLLLVLFTFGIIMFDNLVLEAFKAH